MRRLRFFSPASFMGSPGPETWKEHFLKNQDLVSGLSVLIELEQVGAKPQKVDGNMTGAGNRGLQSNQRGLDQIAKFHRILFYQRLYNVSEITAMITQARFDIFTQISLRLRGRAENHKSLAHRPGSSNSDLL